MTATLATASLTATASAKIDPSQPFTLRQLEQETELSPGKFADLFESFEFRYLPHIQSADSFLRTRSGDCDDYAALADHVLSKHGYTTRIIQVRLVGSNVDHAVCYVNEKRVYLDYNNRKFTFNLERSRPYLRDIAQRVADSLERNWTAVYEFTYSYAERRKRTRYIVVKTADPATDADRINPTNPSSP